MISLELLDSAALKDINPWTFEMNEPGDASFCALFCLNLLESDSCFWN